MPCAVEPLSFATGLKRHQMLAWFLEVVLSWTSQEGIQLVGIDMDHTSSPELSYNWELTQTILQVPLSADDVT